MKKILFISFIIAIFIFATSCKNSTMQNKNDADSVKLTINKYPDSIKNAIIYEVNVRQYTPEGTFAAFQSHLPRLKQLGVKILWLMPIQPIGEKNRKGTLGSPYSVQNYIEINPDFGTKDDFKKLVEEAHKQGMIVILDWVANHTAWDNPWITEHPEWYTHDSAGNIVPPVPDWADVADLNYDNQDMRNEMVNSMKFWLQNFDIDGFRCDMAMMVPTDFWDSARVELDKVKPVFMLAEAEQADLMQTAFDMNYSWKLLHLTEDIAKGQKRGVDLIDYFLDSPKEFPVDKAIRMTFTSNHDENSWNGTVYDRYPDSYKTFAVFMNVIPGMPLIYSGQEACLNHSLRFFEKDTIDWKDCEMTDLYKKLALLKQQNSALFNSTFGAPLEFAATENNENIVSFIRQNDNEKILCLFNLSNQPTQVKYTDNKAVGNYKEFFTDEQISVSLDETINLEPWQYKIMIQKF